MQNLVNFVVNRAKKLRYFNAFNLSFILTIAGLGAIFVIPALEGSFEKVSVSEKALMPLYVSQEYKLIFIG